MKGLTKNSDAIRYTALTNYQTAITNKIIDRGDYTKICATMVIESGAFPVNYYIGTSYEGGNMSIQLRDNSTLNYDGKPNYNNAAISFKDVSVGNSYTVCTDLKYQSSYSSEKGDTLLDKSFYLRIYAWSNKGGSCSVAMKEIWME